MLHFRIFALLALWLVFTMARATSPTVIVDREFEAVDLGPHIELLEDPRREMDLHAVQRSGRFIANTGGSPAMGFTASAWWVRVTLRNASDVGHDLVLRQDYPLIDSLDLWTSDYRGGWRHIATGDMLPFDSRQYAHEAFLFDVPLAAGEERVVYLRYASSGALNIALSLHSSKALLASIGTERLAYGAFYGGFLVLLLYNLFIFIAVRDRPFFYYLLYVASYGVYFGVHNGLSFQYLWPTNPQWGNLSLLVLLSLTLVFGLQFSRLFLDSRNVAPRLDRLSSVLQAIALSALPASLLLPYSMLIAPLSYLTVVVTITMIAMGGFGLLAGYRPARYFMLAWGLLLAGVLMYMAKTFGLLAHSPLAQNAFQVGALLEMVLLSIALGARVTELQKQSVTDALTDLGNRRYFDDSLAMHFQASRRRDDSIALLIADIDHFKQFNDRYGHARGDEVLKLVGRELKRRLPASFVAARYGGEEFAVVLPRMNGAAAAALAESLRSSLQSLRPAGDRITISIGVASSSEGHFDSALALFKAADQALYQAKTDGRNRVVLYRPGPATVAAEGALPG